MIPDLTCAASGTRTRWQRCSSFATRSSARSRACPSGRAGRTRRRRHASGGGLRGRVSPPAGWCSWAPPSSRRLAVRASARRHGIATALLELADDETRAAGARRLVLHAQRTRARSTRPRDMSPAGGSSWRRESSTSRRRSTSSRGKLMPELRIDPLTGQRALVAGARAQRPGGELSATPAPPPDATTTRSPTGTRAPHAAGAVCAAAGRGCRRHPRMEGAGVPTPDPALEPDAAGARARGQP